MLWVSTSLVDIYYGVWALIDVDSVPTIVYGSEVYSIGNGTTLYRYRTFITSPPYKKYAIKHAKLSSK